MKMVKIMNTAPDTTPIARGITCIKMFLDDSNPGWKQCMILVSRSPSTANTVNESKACTKSPNWSLYADKSTDPDAGEGRKPLAVMIQSASGRCCRCNDQ
ncbi:Cof-type HAD-IIB family hydrolase [Sesbania bispinosa]|nr:Cof-type HAD-IIB family hydrolase [Sesbania bispinosa]